jgi:hypothetical protein
MLVDSERRALARKGSYRLRVRYQADHFRLNVNSPQKTAQARDQGYPALSGCSVQFDGEVAFLAHLFMLA